MKVVHVSAPMLQHLETSESVANEYTEPDCQFMISGRGLIFFHYTGKLINEYCIPDAHLAC